MKHKEQSEIVSEIEKLKQKPQLNRRERRYLAKLEEKVNPLPKNIINRNWKGLVTKVLLAVIAFSMVGAAGWYLTTRPKFPPIDVAGHIEENPSSHILDTEMPEPIQKHILEHSDGIGKPGVLIQYNCKKFDCDKNFIGNLKTLVKKYPENVYLSPGNYDGKIILTKLGQRKILSSFDEKTIADFIINK